MTRAAALPLGLTALLVVSSAASAQNPERLEPRLVARGQVSTPNSPDQDGQPSANAYATREQLGNLLRGLPPGVRDVLRADPSLIDRPDYLAPYPQLAQFLQEHPEVARNPSFFLGSPNFGRGPDPTEILGGVLAGTAAFITVMTVLVMFGAIARQVVLYRRWVRQTRMQAEVHTKILDRLQSNEDLLAYIQTPAGRNFLEFTPAQTESEPTMSNAPIGRILWSVQAGVVLVALGLGLKFTQNAVPEEVVPGFMVLAVIVTALGLGAIVSAAVAYALSARLGLMPSRRQDT